MANSTDQFLLRHVQTTYRDGGVSLHPLQRDGLVASTSHSLWPRQNSRSGASMLDAPPAAQWTDLSLPPVVPLIGSPRDPRFMVS